MRFRSEMTALIFKGTSLLCIDQTIGNQRIDYLGQCEAVFRHFSRWDMVHIIEVGTDETSALEGSRT
jgi:hypothetical protein